MRLRDVIGERIRAEGPIPFAQFMELALYHPELGYYARSDQRSGRAGDFVTSVDLGPLYGELLTVQFAQMADILRDGGPTTPDPIDFVEVAAGNGRLSRDVLDTARDSFPDFYRNVRVTLVERSARGRLAHEVTLCDHLHKRHLSTPALPNDVTGIVFANELLDAMPVHAVVMSRDGLREVYVDSPRDEETQHDTASRFVERLGPPSDAVARHMERFEIEIPLGGRAEVCPAAVHWLEEVSRSLKRGFLILVDYGHEARELYSPTHSQGTLTTFRRHVAQTGVAPGATPWLDDPGGDDITAHVDLTSVQEAAEAAGFETKAVVDQSYFLLGLGAADISQPQSPVAALKRRLALKSLLIPGGLGSTHKVLIFCKDVDVPPLLGCQFSTRMT